MACKFRESQIALEWWRASGEKTERRLADLVEHWMNVHAIREEWERKAIHADALANRYAWEITQ